MARLMLIPKRIWRGCSDFTRRVPGAAALEPLPVWGGLFGFLGAAAGGEDAGGEEHVNEGSGGDPVIHGVNSFRFSSLFAALER